MLLLSVWKGAGRTCQLQDTLGTFQKLLSGHKGFNSNPNLAEEQEGQFSSGGWSHILAIRSTQQYIRLTTSKRTTLPEN